MYATCLFPAMPRGLIYRQAQDVAIPLVTNIPFTFYLTYVACFTPTASLLLLLSPETTCISPNKINVGPYARPVVDLSKSEEKDLRMINKVDIHSRASQRKRP